MGALKNIERKVLGLKGRMYFMRLIRNPNDSDAIFKMQTALKAATPPEVIAKFMERAYTDPRLRAQFEARYWPTVPAFEVLEAMPLGSLGRAWATFVNGNGLDKDLFPVPGLDSASDYLTSRIYQAHDVWHVLTGYGVGVEDELSLQAFGVGQYKQALSLLIISGGLIHLLEREPERALEILGSVSEGLARGLAARNLLCEPVLERLEDPLEDVRADLGITLRGLRVQPEGGGRQS